MADQVVMSPPIGNNDPLGESSQGSQVSIAPMQTTNLQMMSEDEEKEDQEIQMKPAGEGLTMAAPPDEEEEAELTVQAKLDGSGQNQVSGDLSATIRSAHGEGQPLPEPVNKELSKKIGTEFNDVRVHHNSRSVQMNRELGARAFTYGNNIFFNQGEYNPGSSQGKHLLAHELVHVVQQKSHDELIQRYEDEWTVPNAEITISLSGITFYPQSHTLSTSRTYRQQGYAIALRKLLGPQYEEGLENRIPQHGTYHGLWSDPDRVPPREGLRMGPITLYYENALNLMAWLEENDYNIVGITSGERALLELGRVTGDLYLSLQDELPSWVTEFIFQRLMARHGSLLEEYRDRQNEIGPYETVVCYGENCLENRILAALNTSVEVLEAIRQDFVLKLDPESQRFYELVWEVPDQGIPAQVADSMLASRFLIFCYTQPVYAERARESHQDRVEIIRRFMNISMPQMAEGRSERVIDEPSAFNMPAFPAYIRSFPPLMPLSGIEHNLPVAFAVTGADYDFSMNLVYQNAYEALGAYFSYGYHWEFSRVPLEAFFEDEVPSDEEAETGTPTLESAIVARLNRAIEYRQEDLETIEEDLGIFAPLAYNLVEFNSILRTLGAITTPFFYELSRPIHERRFVLEEPGVYFISCTTYPRGGRSGEEAVVRIPSEAIYSFPIYVNSAEILAGRHLHSSQIENYNSRQRIREIEEELGQQDLEEDRRGELQRELRQLQVLTGPDVGEEITMRHDAIVRAVLIREKDRILGLPEASREALQERLTTIETALNSEGGYPEEIIALANGIIEERSEASQDDRRFYGPLKQSIKHFSQVLSVQNSRGLENAQRVRASFIGEEGAIIALTIEYVHDSDDDEYVISDLTTPNSGDTAIDDDETDDLNTPAIVIGIVNLLESTAGYGQRGYVAVEWENTRYVREVNAGTARIITEGIDNAVTVIELAALAAAPFTGGASLAILAPVGIIGANAGGV
jgi:hypothetical protein